MCAWRAAWFLGFWLFASLASFTKGWHGLLYPLAILGVAALFSRENRINLRGLISWKGALLFLLINLPWYIYVEFRFPGYLHNLLVAEQLGHVIGASTPATHYANVPRLQFLLLQLAWLFPWSLAILAAASDCHSVRAAALASGDELSESGRLGLVRGDPRLGLTVPDRDKITMRWPCGRQLR